MILTLNALFQVFLYLNDSSHTSSFFTNFAFPLQLLFYQFFQTISLFLAIDNRSINIAFPIHSLYLTTYKPFQMKMAKMDVVILLD